MKSKSSRKTLKLGTDLSWLALRKASPRNSPENSWAEIRKNKLTTCIYSRNKYSSVSAMWVKQVWLLPSQSTYFHGGNDSHTYAYMITYIYAYIHTYVYYI